MNKAINDMEQLTDKVKDITSVLKLQNENAEITKQNDKKLKEMSNKMDYIISQTISECPICYTPTSVKNSCCMSSCRHHMCTSCYYKWTDVKGKNSCPICRSDIFKLNNKIQDTRDDLEREVASYSQYSQQIIDDYNKQIKEKKEELELRIKELDNAYDQISKLDNELHEIYDDIDDANTKLDNMNDYVSQIQTYKRNPTQWTNQYDSWLTAEISKGRREWRKNIAKVNRSFMLKNRIKNISSQNKVNLINQDENEIRLINLEMRRVETISNCHTVTNGIGLANTILEAYLGI
jgi:DNA repair exonuclease SbcCD ATPase subunit